MTKTLTLPLKKKWFGMIASGVKTEEYRELKPFWIRRLVESWQKVMSNYAVSVVEHITGLIPALPMDCKFKKYDLVEFTLGYPSKDDKERRMTFEINDIVVGMGKPEWGAPTDKRVFIIKLGKRL